MPYIKLNDGLSSFLPSFLPSLPFPFPSLPFPSLFLFLLHGPGFVRCSTRARRLAGCLAGWLACWLSFRLSLCLSFCSPVFLFLCLSVCRLALFPFPSSSSAVRPLPLLTRAAAVAMYTVKQLESIFSQQLFWSPRQFLGLCVDKPHDGPKEWLLRSGSLTPRRRRWTPGSGTHPCATTSSACTS
jgi:hypothetical protein